jgi:hypothetical protein
MPHVIRLRGPWECVPVARDAPDAAAAVRCTRRFNAPTNLDSDERVWLVCDAVETRAAFALNDRRLGTIEGHRAQPRIDITDELRPTNVLAIEVELASGAPPPVAGYDESHGLPGGIGQVRLEIGRHAPDWKIENLDER